MRKRILIAAASGILLLLLGIALLVLVGAKDTPFDDVLRILLDYQETLHDRLARDVHLPRTLSALLTGGLFIVNGVMMWGISRNPATGPPILGTTQGSVMFVAIAPMLPLFTAAGNFWTALVGAGFSGLLAPLFAVRYTGHPDVSRILLAGSALSIFLLPAVSLSVPVQSRSQELALWIAGGFWQVDWGTVIDLGIVTFVCTGSFLLLSGKVGLLSFGDEAAISLGIDAAELKKRVVLMMIPFRVVYVAVAGNTGFVGLFVLHILRNMLSRDIRHTPPLSFLFGDVLMVFSDIIARTLSVPYELPVGLSTALLRIPVSLPLVREECG